MEIRRYEDREDARGVARVNALAWRTAYDDLLPAGVLDTLDPDPDEATVDRFRDTLSANRRGVSVAVEEGTVRGYADVRWGDAGTEEFVGEDEADLKAVYVDPDRWGEGVGTALLERGLDALPDDVRTLRLETLEGNAAGRRFYEARGSSPRGRRATRSAASRTRPRCTRGRCERVRDRAF